MKHYNSGNVELSKARIESLVNAYMNSTSPMYRVIAKHVKGDASSYYVVNNASDEVHSSWNDLQTALQVMRDLNRMVA